mmetsp:Transcript_4843/g.8410  ORF Transcript_4843/g.8410 Transcript_4843/m.8410 type:complete len:289 (-) Transcript_4843:869-1735(-)
MLRTGGEAGRIVSTVAMGGDDAGATATEAAGGCDAGNGVHEEKTLATAGEGCLAGTLAGLSVRTHMLLTVGTLSRMTDALLHDLTAPARCTSLLRILRAASPDDSEQLDAVDAVVLEENLEEALYRIGDLIKRVGLLGEGALDGPDSKRSAEGIAKGFSLESRLSMGPGAEGACKLTSSPACFLAQTSSHRSEIMRMRSTDICAVCGCAASPDALLPTALTPLITLFTLLSKVRRLASTLGLPSSTDESSSNNLLLFSSASSVNVVGDRTSSAVSTPSSSTSSSLDQT